MCHFRSWDKPNLPYEKEWQRIVWNTKISVRNVMSDITLYILFYYSVSHLYTYPKLF